MKLHISCKNKKYLDLDAFLDTIISFSHLEKKIPFLDLFTNSKQRYTKISLWKLDGFQISPEKNFAFGWPFRALAGLIRSSGFNNTAKIVCSDCELSRLLPNIQDHKGDLSILAMFRYAI